MKLMSTFAAALVAASAILPVAASAQNRVVVHERTVVRHDRHWGNNHRATQCNWKWRNHHRVRVCRSARW